MRSRLPHPRDSPGLGEAIQTKSLDGRIDPARWGAVRIAPLLATEPDPATRPAPGRFRVVREGSVLHFGITCDELDTKDLTISTRKNDDPAIVDGDHVLVLIATSMRPACEITINPAGAFYDAAQATGGRGIEWSSGAQVAVHRDEDRWSIGIRLPIVGEEASTLDPAKGIAGAQPTELSPWRFNIGRVRMTGGKVEHTASSPIGREDLRATEKFAKRWGK